MYYLDHFKNPGLIDYCACRLTSIYGSRIMLSQQTERLTNKHTDVTYQTQTADTVWHRWMQRHLQLLSSSKFTDKHEHHNVIHLLAEWYEWQSYSKVVADEWENLIRSSTKVPKWGRAIYRRVQNQGFFKAQPSGFFGFFWTSRKK